MSAEDVAARRDLAESMVFGSGMNDEVWRVMALATEYMAPATVRALAARRMTLQPANRRWAAVYWPQVMDWNGQQEVRHWHLLADGEECARAPHRAAGMMAHELAHILCRHGERKYRGPEGCRELTAEAWAIRWGFGKRRRAALRNGLRENERDETHRIIEQGSWWLDRQQALADRNAPVPDCALSGECPALARMEAQLGPQVQVTCRLSATADGRTVVVGEWDSTREGQA